MKNHFFVAAWCLLLCSSQAIMAQQIAFPGAEGYGKFASGGRGGVVGEVTNILDYDPSTETPIPGSLRYVVNNSDKTKPLTVVFKVSGVIFSKTKYLELNRSNVTYAGQTAPGAGICLRGSKVKISGNNVIVRYMRFRVGDDLKISLSCVGTENFKRVIYDHCSFSWSVEENITMYDNDSTTLQYCIISEPLYNSYNVKGARAYGCQFGGEYASYHHNLIADCVSRAPRFNGSSENDYHAFVDFRNNVLFNCGKSYGGEIRNGGVACFSQIVNNYYKKPLVNYFVAPSSPYGKWYVTGNYMEGNATVTADNWKGGVSFSGISVDDIRALQPYDNFQIRTQTAQDAYQTVLDSAGAILPMRDSVDLRIINQVNGTVPPSVIATYNKPGIIDSPSEVGGWPTYVSTAPPVDADHDGMPDVWESEHGLDPNDPSDGPKITTNGYSNLENYLNYGILPVETNVKKTAVDINPVYQDVSFQNIHISKIESVGQLSLYDLSGKKLLAVSNPKENSINISDYNSGVYFLKVSYINGDIVTFKVMHL